VRYTIPHSLLDVVDEVPSKESILEIMAQEAVHKELKKIMELLLLCGTTGYTPVLDSSSTQVLFRRLIQQRPAITQVRGEGGYGIASKSILVPWFSKITVKNLAVGAVARVVYTYLTSRTKTAGNKRVSNLFAQALQVE